MHRTDVGDGGFDAQGRTTGASRRAVWAPGGRTRVVFGFESGGRKIVEIELVADSARLRRLDLIVLDD